MSHIHGHHDHYDQTDAAAAGMTAGMMIAILGFIVAAAIVLALLVWTPWNDGNGAGTTNITNNPVPAQQNSGGGTQPGSGTQPGGTQPGSTQPGGTQPGSGTQPGGTGINPR